MEKLSEDFEYHLTLQNEKIIQYTLCYFIWEAKFMHLLNEITTFHFTSVRHTRKRLVGTKAAAVLCKQVLTISRGQPSSPFCEWDQINSKESFKSHIRAYQSFALDCPKLPSHFHPLPSAQRPAPSTSPCSFSPETLVFLLFLQPATSAPSLGPPASDPPTPGNCMAPTFMSLRPCEALAL